MLPFLAIESCDRENEFRDQVISVMTKIRCCSQAGSILIRVGFYNEYVFLDDGE